jgi:WD40 repeat protein
VDAHDGAVLALAPDARELGFVSAGDDGALMRISSAGALTKIHSTGGKWIEQLATYAEARSGLIACSAGKNVLLFDEAGVLQKTLAHPSTVTGLAFDAKGKRLGASHYNGATLWFTQSKNPTPRLLEWKGSHTGITLHPAAEALVTTMQENALHGWRLSDNQHMRMTGYPAKTESIGFTRSGKWLASSGADCIVLWPFFGGGPMGKPPVELAPVEDILCTRIACHPKEDIVAAGFANGMVVLAEISSKRVVVIAEAGGAPVSALAWNGSGGRLAIGTEHGQAVLVNLSASA